MRALYRDALICDFAEYYHLYSFDSVPLETAAILACGLPADSRTIRKLSGQKFSTDMILKIRLVDAVQSFEHAFVSVHSKKKVPKPQSLMKMLTKQDDKDIRSFRSAAEFEMERERLLRGA